MQKIFRFTRKVLKNIGNKKFKKLKKNMFDKTENLKVNIDTSSTTWNKMKRPRKKITSESRLAIMITISTILPPHRLMVIFSSKILNLKNTI